MKKKIKSCVTRGDNETRKKRRKYGIMVGGKEGRHE